MRPVRILVFAKAPVPGYAKTRLAPALGAEGAAALARRMLEAALALALDAGVGPVELCAAPHPGDARWRGFALPAGTDVSAQGAGSLGARMARAAGRACARGEAAVLMGTDCADLTAAHLRAAADRVGRGECVLHPTADGGYALFALPRMDASLFHGIAWSTAGVAEATVARVRALGWPLHLGATLRDIDTAEDLPWLPPHLLAG